MKVVLDNVVSQELKTFLLAQVGVVDVDFFVKDFISEINVKINEKTTPEIIMKYIDLFQDNKYSTLLSFDKEEIENFKNLKYVIKDICCEYCYMSFVGDLFENKFIKSVKSDFKIYKPLFNIEFIIEYSSDYAEDKLIEFIKQKSL